MRNFLIFATALIGFALPAFAQVEDDYSPAEPRATTPWLEWMTPANIAADLDFVEGMRPHHAGALTMSADYFKSKKASSARLHALARSIVTNQSFEIKVMDRMEELLKTAPNTDTPVLTQVAERGLAQAMKFSHAPAPFIASPAQDDVSKHDVQFAKAMIIHHEGALDMCHDYLGNPAAINGYMELLCLDILTSQSQEIALMHDIIADYPGDAGKIKPSAIHGMEHMSHGQQGHHHHKGH